jgi:hypothetical protein
VLVWPFVSMSNSIKITAFDVLLDKGFDVSKLKDVKDLDGNEVYNDHGEWFFRPAGYTTWRELRNFIKTYVSPAVNTTDQARVDLPEVRDEYDDFTSQFTMHLWFNSPDWELLAN